MKHTVGCLFGLVGLAAALMGCGQLSFPSFSQALPQDRPAVQGRLLYEEAWRLIDTEYVDATLNHQSWLRWRHRYDPWIHTSADAYMGIKTMLASLNDEYTRFLDPKESEEQSISIESKLSGVGLQIMGRSSRLQVVAPLPDTPAEKAGVKPKDIIVTIDGQPTTGLTVEQAADRIRGEEGTVVQLGILRGNRRLAFKMVRQKIAIKSVFQKDLSPDIGYIRLASFISETARDEMHQALEKDRHKRGLILDLRENFGGLLPNAVDIADMFLDKGVIVSTVDRDGSTRKFEAAPGEEARQPLVVLIDQGSASASEILSGALKDHRRATLVGARTFGKGLVQKIEFLADGSGINVTVSKYLTPNGHDINKKGILPDVPVALTLHDLQVGYDRQLEAGKAVLEKELQHHA